MKSNPFATLAYGAMTLLVAVYIAFVALLMHHDAMPIPVFAGHCVCWRCRAAAGRKWRAGP